MHYTFAVDTVSILVPNEQSFSGLQVGLGQLSLEGIDDYHQSVKLKDLALWTYVGKHHCFTEGDGAGGHRVVVVRERRRRRTGADCPEANVSRIIPMRGELLLDSPLAPFWAICSR